MSSGNKLLSWLFRMKKRRQLLVVAVLATVVTLVVLARHGRETDVRSFGDSYAETNPKDDNVNRYIKTNPNLAKNRSSVDVHLPVRVLQFQDSQQNPPPMKSPQRKGSNSTTQDSISPAVKKAENNTECSWVFRSTEKPPYFLTAVVLLRIYETDKAKLTTRELKQWLQYMRYIGVEHVYVYDAYYHTEEIQDELLTEFYKDSYVTYDDWHEHNPYTIQGTQVAGYQDCINKYGHESVWQTAIDIDEYPFAPSDTEPGFLPRYVRRFIEKHPDVGEITMQNYLFLGKPLERELLFERMWRRTRTPANPLVKPIYKPANTRAQVHHNYLKSGRSKNAPSNELRLNHYWGARLQNWGEDTPEIIAKTEEDRGMEPVVAAFKDCERHIRPYLE